MHYVYILANHSNEVIYIGVTNDLRRQLREHREGRIEGFTKKYHVKKLLYYESYSSPIDAVSRERQLKKWTREKKNNLIALKNPNWDDWSEAF